MIALVIVTVCILLSLLWQLYRWSILSSPSSSQILSLIEEKLSQLGLCKEETLLVDLGSGIGSTLGFFASRGWKKTRGIEGFFPIWLVSIFIRFSLQRKYSLKWGDYRLESLETEQKKVMFAYISPWAMREMEQWLEEKKPSFCWLITHTFALPTKKPDLVLWANDLYRSPVYFYKGYSWDQPID